jgi:hypothetical protein
MLTEKQFEGLKKSNLSVDAQKSKERISEGFKAASSEVKNAILSLSGLTRTTFYNAFQKGTASPKMVLSMAQSLGVSPYYYTGESDEKGEFSADILKTFLTDKKLVTTAKASKTAKATRAVKKAAVKAAKPVKAAAKPVKAAAKAAKAPVKRGRKSAVKADAPVKAAAPKAAAKAPKAVTKASAKTAKIPAKAAKATKMPVAKDDVFIQISIPKSPKLQKAIANLDEEGAVLLLRALMRKSNASDQAKALCDIIKSCLLS